MVAARDGVIVAAGPASEVGPAHPDLPLRDLGDCMLLPGLIDAHCHLEWSLTGGLIAPTTFAAWLRRFIPLRMRMAPQDHRAAADLGALLAAEAGTTTLADSGPTGAGVAAAGAAGLRARVHLEAFGREEGAAARQAAARFAERLTALDAEAGPRVGVGVSPHAPYTVGPGLWAALAGREDLAARPWATHLAESPDEARLLDRGDGPLAALFRDSGLEPGRWPDGGPGVIPRVDAAGALRPGLVAAHCVQVDARGAALLAAAAVGVAHCPASNARLACGLAPLAALREAGVAVGLGTDSPASAGPYDLRAEARACITAHGAAALVPPSPAELVEAMTRGAARVLGLDHLVGSIAPGLRCDLVALAPAPGAEPGDPCAAALDPRARVVMTAVDAVPVVEGGRTVRMDREGVLARARGARGRLC
ncbi:MAG: amidohydrolase family protein [Thermoleophilia bacterium]|nr:amidohydrolase family protein [Thermoleophilia bacterium]